MAATPFFSDTIVAQCTPHGSGALALIRVSGPQAWEISGAILTLKSGKKLLEVPSHTVHMADVIAKDQLIDSLMVIALRGPRTFTGFDTIEITPHNNPLIIQTIIELLIHHGARPAQPGEFSRQAYENKKIDLVQAEAIHELITAQTHQAVKQSLSQLQGSLSTHLETIEDLLCKTLAWCECSFEFLDDEGDFYDQICGFLDEITHTIQPLIADFSAQKQLRQGYRIALLGGVNAGKSSLFNLLIGQKRAIVTPIAGTTRDSIESTLILPEATFTLIDTAGLRTTQDVVEQEGIERSYAEAHASDLILLVIAGDATLAPQEEAIYRDLIEKYRSKIIFIQNKADKHPESHDFFDTMGIQPSIISAQRTQDRTPLLALISEQLSQLARTHQAPFLINKRHYELLQTTLSQITTLQDMLKHNENNPHYELISYHLKQALETLSEVTGKTAGEAALDRVFKEFCVGK